MSISLDQTALRVYTESMDRQIETGRPVDFDHDAEQRRAQLDEAWHALAVSAARREYVMEAGYDGE